MCRRDHRQWLGEEVRNRLNGLGLDVQCHDNYDMGILGKIVKIFTRDLPELEYGNLSYAQVGPCVWCCGVQVLGCRG